MGIGAKERVHGEKIIEVKLRFWTNCLADRKGRIIPKQTWPSGLVGIEGDKSHEIVPREPIPFHSLLDLGRAIEKCLLDQGMQLHPSKRARKYAPPTNT